MFLRSLMPDFELLNIPNPRAEQAAPADVPPPPRVHRGRNRRAGAAVGGVQVGGGAELRLGVNNLLDALRNLLTNLQPVANVDGGQEGDMEEEDEWSPVEDETDENDHLD